MDTAPQSASSALNEFSAGLPAQQEEDVEEAEEHAHLPKPSYWPILLSLAIAIVVAGLLFVPSTFWIIPVALLFALICILGWGLEDPLAPVKEQFVTIRQKVDPWKFKIGQNVIDFQGKWLGKVQARFSRYILVERGFLLPKVFYVPLSATREQIKNNTVFLTLSEDDLVRMDLNRVPDDLYDEVPDAG